jgi:hypothetical protein
MSMKVVIEHLDGSRYTYEDIEQIQQHDQQKTALLKEGQFVAIVQNSEIKSLHTVDPEQSPAE